MRPPVRTLVLLMLLGLLAAACGGNNTSGGGGGGGGCPSGGVKVGFFGALTGDNAALGINIRNGEQLAINQYNSSNPSCKVTLQNFDSQGDPAQAPALATQAVGDKSLVAIVGPAFSGESKAADPIFNEAGLPIITPSATGVALSENGWKIFHRAVGNDNSQAPVAAQFIKDQLKASKVAVVDDKSEYGKGIADIVRKTLGSAATVSDAINVQAQDYSSTVSKVKAGNVDAIFYGGYYAEGGRLLKQLRDAGVKATFVSDDGAKDDNLIKTAGQSAAEGAYMTCPCAPPEKVKNGTKFISDYKSAFNADPGTYSAEGYDAANMILAAIKSGKTDRNGINDYLGSSSFEGITKNLKFDAKGEVAEKKIYVYQVKGGKIVATSFGPYTPAA
jgi:branched-chain amino acid transport system substrate-binding protein